MGMSFRNAGPQGGDLIPAGTVCKVIMKVKPDGVGEEGFFKLTNAGTVFCLDTELTVVEGPYAKRIVYALIPIVPTKDATDGQKKWVNGGNATLRAILECARNIDPKDPSPEADVQRDVKEWAKELQGMEFLIKVGIDKGDDAHDPETRSPLF